MSKRPSEDTSHLQPSKRLRTGIKWNTLSHNGPRFPSPLKPKDNDFRYKGKVLRLKQETKEVAALYAKYLRRPANKRLSPKLERRMKQNFFQSWRQVMTSREREKIQQFRYCSFVGLKTMLNQRANKKSTMAKGQKTRQRNERMKQSQKYGYAIVDGRKELISNYTVEPPSLFFGRGDNPHIGKVKRRIHPEDVTINCGESRVPKPPEGRKWKNVIHDKTKSWLACWEDPISGRMKYIDLHSSSKLKSQREEEKFKKAEELEKHIEQIRDKYKKDLKLKGETGQNATATYLIDNWALRVGNEKGENETDTVGCCSLRKEHIRILAGLKVTLKFDGKDSVPYENTLRVSPVVYENLKRFTRGKSPDDLLFNEITTTKLNQYLSNLMPGLTAKVFRTYRATELFTKTLNRLADVELPTDKGLKVKVFIQCHRRANLEVAKLLNHQNMTSSQGRVKTVKRQRQKIDDLEQERNYLRTQLRKADRNTLPKLTKDLESVKEELKFERDELELKEQLVKYSLGTSQLNYIDPRRCIRWLNKHRLPHDKIYSTAQIARFGWAKAKLPRGKKTKDKQPEANGAAEDGMVLE